MSILSSGLIWSAGLAGVPSLYIAMGSLIVFGIGFGIFRIISRSRSRSHSHSQTPED